MPRIKICGLRDLGAAVTAAEAGAAFLGFNFVPSSRRWIEPAEARTIIQELRQRLGEATPTIVGVFANQPALFINSTAEFCGLDMVQLSGDEALAACETISQPVIKAIRVDPEQPPERELRHVRRLLRVAEVKGILPLLDRYDIRAYGGTGKPLDWELAKQAALEHRLLLAGGLTPENVAQAVALVQPWGVDVASGVETNGVQDPVKIMAFLQAVRQSEGKEGANRRPV